MAQTSTPDMVLFEAVKDFAETGDKCKTAENLNTSEMTVRRRLKMAKRRGITPEWTPPPETERSPLKLFGTSTLYDQDGNIVLEWEKRRAESQQIHDLIRETADAFMAPLSGFYKPKKPPKTTTADLLTEYIITDLHVGMLSWAAETGADYDTGIAVDDCMAAMDRLFERTPMSEQAVINVMGDYFHMDTGANTTAAGTPLDVDTRYIKVVRAGVMACRYVIEQALNKHKTIRVRITPGNHDTHSALVLSFAIAAYYEAEPRVIVEDDPRPFWAYRFGKCLVGIGHGHAPKPKDMPGLLAHDYPDWWAECCYRYGRHGHLHHARSFEEIGVKTEGFRTLAPKDHWHAAMGYRAMQEAQAIVLHKEWGEVERHTAGLREIRSRA